MDDVCDAPGGYEGGRCRRRSGHDGYHAHRTSWGQKMWPPTPTVAEGGE